MDNFYAMKYYYSITTLKCTKGVNSWPILVSDKEAVVCESAGLGRSS